MSLTRGNNYAAAGMAGDDAEKFQIHHSVFILDATAGQRYDAYDGSDAVEYDRTHSQSFGISLKHLMRGFIALTILLAVILTVNAVRINKKAHEISELEEQVRVLSETNHQLDEKIVQARDLTRISYAAVQNLGMIPVEEVEVHYITAPDTRPFAIKGETGQ